MAQIAPYVYLSGYRGVPTLTPTVGRTFIELHPAKAHEIRIRRIILFIEQSQLFRFIK